MATTEIHAITKTPEKALAYIMKDKILEYSPEMKINPDNPYKIIEENGKKYVKFFTLNTNQFCDFLNPINTYKELQSHWQNKRYCNTHNHKEGAQIVMWHLVQSFNGVEVDPVTASNIGLELAREVFRSFSVTISTHTNTENIHNHFIISAWDNTGHKWYNNHASTRKIREVSDRLCEKYGLSVIEETRNMNLVKYTDKDGRTRYFEPTDRKMELIRKRKAGELTTDDINSYRNSSTYKEEQQKKITNRDIIKLDIDNVLPTCRSYEELLERLRDLGYRIRDKKKDGGWVAHIAFQAPLQDKATREDKIGDGSFYTRENLTRYIEFHAQELALDEQNNHVYELATNIPFFENYEYGSFDLLKVNDDYKAVEIDDSDLRIVERPAAEKKILAFVRTKDNEVRGLIDTTELYKIIAEQKDLKKQKKPYLTRTQEHRLVAQIQCSFQCLRYSEQHHIFSYKQIFDLYTANKTKYDATIDNFKKAESVIERLKEALAVPQKLSALQDKIDSNKSNVSYILEKYNADRKMVEHYKATMAKYKIDTPQGEQSLRAKVSEYETKQNANRGYMADVITNMAELENCIRTFDRIDRESGKEENETVRKFEKMSGLVISGTCPTMPEMEKKKPAKVTHDR